MPEFAERYFQEQYNQLRHYETTRATLTSVGAVLLGAALTNLLGTGDLRSDRWPIALFIGTLALLMRLIVIRLNQRTEVSRKIIRELTEQMNHNLVATDSGMNICEIEKKCESIVKGRLEPVKLGKTFQLLFAVIMLGSFILAGYMMYHNFVDRKSTQTTDEKECLPVDLSSLRIPQISAAQSLQRSADAQEKIATALTTCSTLPACKGGLPIPNFQHRRRYHGFSVKRKCECPANLTVK